MSNKLKTLTRRNLVLLVLGIGLGAWVLLRPEPTTSVREEALPKVFPDFAREDVRRVELGAAAHGEKPERRVVLQMADASTWHLESHFRYPVQSGADRLLDAIAASRQRAVVTEREETFENYAGDAGWTEVSVLDSRGRTLTAFGLGRYQYPDTFLRVGAGDGARVVRATGIVPNMASVDPKSWIDTRVWPALSATDMIRIDVEQRRDDRTITIVKRGEDAADLEMEAPEKSDDKEKTYWMASPVEGDAKKLAVEDLAREFTGMLIDDIVAGSLSEEEEKQYGFDDPELVATLYVKVEDKVTKHRLTVGRKSDSGDVWYVRRGGAAWVFAVSSGTGVNRLRQAPESFLQPPPGAEEVGEGNGDERKGGGPGDPDGASPGDSGGDAPKEPPKEPQPPKGPPKDEDPEKDG